MSKNKDKPEPLDLEQQDFVVQQMQKELSAILDDTGKPLPKTEKHVLRAICQMAAFSLSNQRIANNIGLPRKRVDNILKSISVQREIQRLQTELYERDATKMFKRMLPHAANTIYGLIDKADKDSTRVEAAKVILDRALGKPTQTIEQTTTLISDVLKKLNTVPSEVVNDAFIIPELKKPEVKAPDPAAVKDPLEDILFPDETGQGG